MTAQPWDIVEEMFALGVAMRRARVRREAPQLSDAEVDAVVDAWLVSRPGAEFGDSAGVPVPWPRR